MAKLIYTEPAQKQGGATKTTQLSKQIAPKQQENQRQKNAVGHAKDVTQLEIQPQAQKQKQSQEMVQIMLHVSFGTLFYLREFLPLPCFEERDMLKLCHRDTHISYGDFIGNKPMDRSQEASSRSPSVTGRRGQPLKVLIRNRDESADAVLDLLEHGIFEAIGKNVLEAVQLTVFVDKDVPSNVLESYTFSFKYTGGLSDDNNRLASISLEQTECTADMKTTRSAKLGLEMIVRRIITLSSFLPILPNKRFLGVHLFYSEDCPPEYEPPGFTRSTDDKLIFPHGEDWTRESQSCGTMESGFHTVGLKVTSLKWSGPDQNDSGSIKQITDDIEYSTTISREEDIGIEKDDIPQVVRSEPSSSQQSTQTRQDTVAKKMLQKMIVPSTPDSALVPTQAVEDSLGSMVHGDTFKGFTRPQLSQAKLAGLEKQHTKPGPILQGGRAASSRDGDDNAVNCQCGWQGGDDGDMIKCVFCRTQQHLLCHGFLDANDPNIPDTHVCYKCLLEPNEAPLLREMGTLVLLRRALRVIMEEGYPNRTRDFSQKLHCNGQTVVQITDLLKKQRLLHATPGSKSKGFTEKGLPKFSVPDSSEVRERIQQEIFDPFVKIAHHYTFSGASQLVPDSSVPSAPTQASTASAVGTDSSSSPDDSQLSFLDAHGHTQRQEHGEVARVADRNPGTGSWDSQGSKRSLPGTAEGLQRSGVPAAAGKRRKMSGIISPVDMREPSEDSSP